MEAYITGLGNISPQPTFDPNYFLEEVRAYYDNQLTCMAPDYKPYIPPRMARRMGKSLKMGVAAAHICLKDAQVAVPDAIVTGTSFGCIAQTEKFLKALVQQKEQLLSPTAFIQSTHNTIAAQIALLLKCKGYNYTYVHRGFSFESALLDGQLLLKEGAAETVLVGATDELTPSSFTITHRLDHWKKKPVNSLEVLQDDSNGSIAGEGAAFFTLSATKSSHYYATLKGVSTFYKPRGKTVVQDKIRSFLAMHHTNLQKIDLVLLGYNGHRKTDPIYRYLQANCLKDIPAAYYKHLCGEYFTATAFGLWVAAKVIRNQTVPNILRLNEFEDRPICQVLLCNYTKEDHYSLILLSN